MKTAATDAANTIKADILPKTGSIWKSRIYAPLKKDLKTQEHCIETSQEDLKKEQARLSK